MSIRVGIAGVTGYTGVELLRFVTAHPSLDLTWIAAGQSAGQPLFGSWPALRDLVDGVIEPMDAERAIERCDVVFLALPHGHAASIAPTLLAARVTVVDLGADFRLRDPHVYREAYGLEHPSPELLQTAVYGLPELFRPALFGAKLIACPGCYPTAVTLAALPLVEAGLVGDLIIADCLSGVSGAGRSPGPRNVFCEVNEAARPYGMAGTHRHTPEMEQTLGVSVAFTPHLVPMSRGMIATVHMRPRSPMVTAEAREIYASRYSGDPMIVLRDEPPSTADVRGCNRAHIHVVADERRGLVTAVCAIDNLVKGAAGQAVQALNLALGLPEESGIPLFPLLP